jgi:hypothetical protein
MSGLYRTFKENYVPYFADGRGRDRYIAYNNAGFFHNFPKSLSPTNVYKTGTFFGTKIIQHNKSPSVKAPNFHYHSDGNGRDKYILVNGGGLFYDSKPLVSFKLTDFLRKDDYKYRPTGKKRIALSRAEIRYNKLLRSKEKELIKRLYTNEKSKFNKKKKYDPSNWFSSDEIQNDYDDNINKNKTHTYFLPKVINNLTENNKNDNKNILCSNSKLRNKPKIVIDSDNNNKNNLFTKSNKTSKDFYQDIERLNKYQTIQNHNKSLIKYRKQPYFHILNEHSAEKIEI